MRPPLAYSFDIASPIQFSRTGKFEAPDDNWHHDTSELKDYELIIVTKNSLYLKYRDTKYTIKEGYYLLLQPLSSQDQDIQDKYRRGYKKSNCSFYWMHFSCKNVSPRYSLGPDKINDGREDIFVPIMGRLISPAKALILLLQLQNSIESDYDCHYNDYPASIILCELSNQYRIQVSQTRMTSSTGSEQLYYDIYNYIKLSIYEPLTINGIAEKFQYNSKYLSKLFKKYAHVSLKRYILQCKIENADFLLLDNNESITEIASRLGFSNYHTFERAYITYKGMSPTTYRQLYSKRIINHS